MKITEIISTTFKRLTGAPGKSLNCNVSDLGDSDAELYSVPGIFAKPADGTKGLQVNLGFGRIIFATHDYKLDKDINTGETLIYSIDNDGNLKAQGHFDKDGNIILNEGTDYAVKFNELKTAFDQLVSDFNAHTHIITAGSVGSGTVTAVAGVTVIDMSTADMSSSKVEKVKL